MKFPLLLCFLLAITFVAPGNAQTTALDTTTVTTTRLPQTLRQTGRNISVLRGAELRQRAFTSLDDLLQYIPGIEVQSRGAFGQQGDISMRGSTFTQVLVLINGMRLNDPLTGHFNGYIPVTPAEIERIEVLRGAASALYGADAVGGVINVVTKQFSTGTARDSSEFLGELNYGDHRLVATQQGFHRTGERFYLGGGFQMNRSDGEPIAERTFEGTTLEPYRNFFDLKTVGLSAGYKFGKRWQLHARSGYDDRDFAARYYYTTSSFDKSTETTQNWFNQLRLSHLGDVSQTDIQVAHRYGSDVFVFSPDFPSTNTHTTQFWNLNFNHRQYLNDHLAVSVGLQADRRSIKSTDRGDHDDHHAGVYAVAEWRAAEGLSLTGSLRLDHDENYGTELSPQLNVAYTTGDLTLRASAGRSIRAADYTERFVSFNLENLTPGRSLGNPDLEAERSWSEEIGADYRATDRWLLRATAFFRQGNNLIDYVPTSQLDIPDATNLVDSATYNFATNIAEVRTTGLEVESWLTQPLPTGNLTWTLGYTYLNTTNEEGVISVYLSSHARHLLNTSFTLQSGDWEFALSGLHKRRDQRTAAAINATLDPNYTVFHGRVGYRLTQQIGVQLRVLNLFDVSYSDILGAPLPGRWVMGGVRLGF